MGEDAAVREREPIERERLALVGVTSAPTEVPSAQPPATSSHECAPARTRSTPVKSVAPSAKPNASQRGASSPWLWIASENRAPAIAAIGVVCPDGKASFSASFGPHRPSFQERGRQRPEIRLMPMVRPLPSTTASRSTRDVRSARSIGTFALFRS